MGTCNYIWKMSDAEDSNTFPIPQMASLHIDESFRQKLKITHRRKQIRKEHRGKDKNAALHLRVAELEKEVADLRRKEQMCPHCSFYLNEEKIHRDSGSRVARETETPIGCDRRTSKESLEFEQINFNSALMSSPEMEEKSWVFLGIVLIAMGSKVMDVDGTVNVFKVLKESVDCIRRQVQKSQSSLSMDFFLSREQIYEPDEVFYTENQEKGLQLEGLKVESVNEYELVFENKIKFSVNYEALLTSMEYVKQYCEFT